MFRDLIHTFSKTVVQILNLIVHDNPLYDEDETLREPNDEYERREATYSAIIEQYQKNQRRNLIQNRWFKGIMFAVCIAILLLMTCGWGYLAYMIFARRMEDTFTGTLLAIATSNSDIALLATAVVPVITAYITLPNTIAKYLFAHSDEDAMTKILSSLLQHDRATNKLLEEVSDDQPGDDDNEDMDEKAS